MKPIRALIIGMLWAASGPISAAGTLEVEQAWVREGPPNAAVLGGFMEVRNPSAQPVEITGVASPAFERVEMHRTVTENGMAKMLPQTKLTVPANGNLSLAPGGYHLMLFAPKQMLHAGQTVALTLRTADGEDIPVTAEVRRGMGTMEHHHMEHQH